jgi:hypothetical protein
VTAADMTRNSTDRQQAGGLKKECTEGTAITQIAELRISTPSRGRPVKFTPARIQQIKNLVERGKSREEISELIGVTVGSLQVICSRLGIILRRPTFNNGLVSLRRNEPRLDQVPTPSSGHGSDSALLQPIKGRLERNSQPQPDEAEHLVPSHQVGKRGKAGAASFAIKMQYRGEERTTELPLTQDTIRQLAFEAAFRNVSMRELIAEIIVALLKRDLLQTVLQHHPGPV